MSCLQIAWPRKPPPPVTSTFMRAAPAARSWRHAYCPAPGCVAAGGTLSPKYPCADCNECRLGLSHPFKDLRTLKRARGNLPGSSWQEIQGMQRALCFLALMALAFAAHAARELT